MVVHVGAIPRPRPTRLTRPSPVEPRPVPARVRALPRGRVVIEKATGRADVVADLLAGLPEWFGIEEANERYAAAAERFPNYIAHERGQALGIALVDRRYAQSAELHLVAVRRDRRRQGVGQALIAAVEDDLRRDGVRLLSLKTLGPSLPDKNYDQTRRFYQSLGFVPVEEFADLWPDTPCLLMVKALGATGS